MDISGKGGRGKEKEGAKVLGATAMAKEKERTATCSESAPCSAKDHTLRLS